MNNLSKYILEKLVIDNDTNIDYKEKLRGVAEKIIDYVESKYKCYNVVDFAFGIDKENKCIYYRFWDKNKMPESKLSEIIDYIAKNYNLRKKCQLSKNNVLYVYPKL